MADLGGHGWHAGISERQSEPARGRAGGACAGDTSRYSPPPGMTRDWQAGPGGKEYWHPAREY